MANETYEIILKVRDEGSQTIKTFADKTEESTQKVNQSIFKTADNWTKKVTGMSLATVASATAIIGGLKQMISAAAAQEQQIKSLESAVNITGVSFEDSKGAIDSFTASMQATTAYGDSEMRPVLQQITLLTGDLQKGFKGAQLAADMAASGLFDINTASRYVAMAMEGEITMLGRYIPQLKASALETKGLTDKTQIAAYAIEILGEKFGGLAQENVKTFSGETSKLKNYLSDLGESIGNIFLPALTTVAAGLAEVTKEINKSITTISSTVISVIRDELPAAYEINEQKARELTARLSSLDQVLASNSLNATSTEPIIKKYRDEIEKLLTTYNKLQQSRIDISTIVTGFPELEITPTVSEPRGEGSETNLYDVQLQERKTSEELMTEYHAEQIRLRQSAEIMLTNTDKEEAEERVRIAEEEAAAKQQINSIFHSAWQTGLNAMISAENTGKDTREQIWQAFKYSAISMIGEIVWAYITGEQSKTAAFVMGEGIKTAAAIAGAAQRAVVWAAENAATIFNTTITLINAAAKYFKSMAWAGPIGFGIAAGLVAAMYGVMQSLPGFATGGEINYGQSGVDRVPIMATRGEYIINQNSTQKYRPLIEAINKDNLSGIQTGRKGYYASGGPVNAGLAGSGGIHITINTQTLDKDVIERDLIPKLRDIALLQRA